ncbi:MAG: CinA family nicotinamide mononucleotide deamidase-related protein, partial [Victivallales bacterium]|nr:CinA family nicotinamide mononucleotide deamidase-related protein [Victivallales bacterium]
RIICIGDELLSGDTVNTNLAFIGEELANRGLNVSSETCVPDDLDAIQGAIRQADGADVLIFIGGLGPTTDDLTRASVAGYLGLQIRSDETLRQHIADYLGERHKNRIPDGYLDIQSQVIDTAELLSNDNGTAPGQLIRHNNALWAMLPGPPREIKPMFLNYLLPKILERRDSVVETLTVRVCALLESQVESKARHAIEGISGLHFAICIKKDCIMIRLSKPEDENQQALDLAKQRLQKEFGHYLLPDECLTTAHYLGLLLKERHLMMATAESCTGGGIAAAMTDTAGSSEWIVGGVVTYANEWKMNVLGVREETLQRHGAVSEATVHQMLDGLQMRFDVEAGVAVSGIAGPGGGTPEKPVGTVVIGAYAPHWRCVKTFHFSGLRDTVRQRTVNAAINLLITGLLETSH